MPDAFTDEVLNAMIIIYVAIVAILIILSFAYINIRKVIVMRKRKRKYSSDYFSPDGSNLSAGRIADISEYWQAKCAKEGLSNYIDAITWDDLDMNQVFTRMNACQSSPGEEVLYSKLHLPLFDKDRLDDFSKTVEHFETDEAGRFKILCLLDELGKGIHLATSLLFGAEDMELDRSLIYSVFGALPLLSIIIMFFSNMGLMFLLVTICINVGIYLSKKSSLNLYTDTISYLLRTVKVAKALTKLDLGNEEYCRKLDSALAGLGKFKVSGKIIQINDEQRWGELGYLFVLVKIIFLLDFISFNSMIRQLAKNHDPLRDVYEAVGEIDCAVAIGAYKKTLPYYCKPDFNGCDNLEFKNLYHPLLDHPVPNTFLWDKNCIITGSNASGKSTFIKAVAVNLITSQSINLSFADSYSGSMCLVFSSMAVRDQIASGDSYFIMELKCLRRMLNMVRGDIRIVCFVDEILRGTNTIERISAAAAVLYWLDKQNCMVMVASHDIELTEILSGTYANYHFREHVSDGIMTFDYTIYPGPANTRNAIALMEQMDFDEEIISTAQKISDTFEIQRHWPIL